MSNLKPIFVGLDCQIDRIGIDHRFYSFDRPISCLENTWYAIGVGETPLLYELPGVRTYTEALAAIERFAP
jgi:hypothetical protein